MRFLFAKIFGWIAKAIQSFGLSLRSRGARGLPRPGLWPNHACDRHLHRSNRIKETHRKICRPGDADFDSVQRYDGQLGRDGDAVDWFD
jgi:hypothetical protein